MLIDSKGILKVMRNEGMRGSEAKQVVKDAREQAIQIFLDNGVKIFKTTVGPGDCLVAPHDFLWAEEPVDHDSMGVKCALFDLRGDAAVKGNVEISSKPSTASDSHHKMLKKCIDSLDETRKPSPMPVPVEGFEMIF